MFKRIWTKLSDSFKNCNQNGFYKLLVGWLILNGTIWTYLSYYLAWLGKHDIAESLSKAVVAEILGVFAAYAYRSMNRK